MSKEKYAQYAANAEYANKYANNLQIEGKNMGTKCAEYVNKFAKNMHNMQNMTITMQINMYKICKEYPKKSNMTKYVIKYATKSAKTNANT